MSVCVRIVASLLNEYFSVVPVICTSGVCFLLTSFELSAQWRFCLVMFLEQRITNFSFAYRCSYLFLPSKEIINFKHVLLFDTHSIRARHSENGQFALRIVLSPVREAQLHFFNWYDNRRCVPMSVLAVSITEDSFLIGGPLGSLSLRSMRFTERRAMLSCNHVRVWINIAVDRNVK